MNINLIYCHPCELEIESLLSREEPYPDTFTLADRTTERITRARTGLVHVMNEILPSVGGEQATVITSWLQKVTSLIDISLIDAESAK
ncbi:nicotinic acetylcholine receptor subunit beta [Escherichia coli]